MAWEVLLDVLDVLFLRLFVEVLDIVLVLLLLSNFTLLAALTKETLTTTGFGSVISLDEIGFDAGSETKT